MAIEITSVRDVRPLAEKLLQPFRSALSAFYTIQVSFPFHLRGTARRFQSNRSLDFLVRSYRFYAGTIDARLASGYLTSRPGDLCCARTLSRGQKLSLRTWWRHSGAPAIPKAMRRASGAAVSAPRQHRFINPNRVKVPDPAVIKVEVMTRSRYALTGDEVTLESPLEAECLTNDLKAKNGERTQLSYHELPPALVHAILSIEDRRFFEHRGWIRWAGTRSVAQRRRRSHRSGWINNHATAGQEHLSLSRADVSTKVRRGDARFRARTPAFKEKTSLPCAVTRSICHRGAVTCGASIQAAYLVWQRHQRPDAG